jgi:hypothetical protein
MFNFYVIVIIVIASDLPYTVGITLVTMVKIVTSLCLLCVVRGLGAKLVFFYS